MLPMCGWLQTAKWLYFTGQFLLIGNDFLERNFDEDTASSRSHGEAFD